MKKLIALGVLFVFLVLGLVSSCSQVEAGNVGVVRHMGAIQPYILVEGISWTRPWPFADVTNVDVKIGSSAAEAHASSNDVQQVKTKVTISWSIVPNSAPAVLRGFGSEELMEKNVLEPGIQEVVKAVTANYTAVQLVTKRNEVKGKIEQELAQFVVKTLEKKNAVGAISIANIAITDFDFSPEFNQSIEAKVKAEQDSYRAENEKKTRITQAEATAKEQTLKADATAYSLDTESKARAAAIKRESEALAASPNLVQLRIAERWDGKLPTYTGNSIPMLQIK